MKLKFKNNGSVFLIVTFVIALLAMVAMGILQMNTQEIQLVQHRLFAAQALAAAEAGLNEAMAEIRQDSSWHRKLPNVPPSGSVGKGSYKIRGDGDKLIITGTVTDWLNYTAKVEAEVTISNDQPCIIRIDKYIVNEQ